MSEWSNWSKNWNNLFLSRSKPTQTNWQLQKIAFWPSKRNASITISTYFLWVLIRQISAWETCASESDFAFTRLWWGNREKRTAKWLTRFNFWRFRNFENQKEIVWSMFCINLNLILKFRKNFYFPLTLRPLLQAQTADCSKPSKTIHLNACKCLISFSPLSSFFAPTIVRAWRTA